MAAILTAFVVDLKRSERKSGDRWNVFSLGTHIHYIMFDFSLLELECNS